VTGFLRLLSARLARVVATVGLTISVTLEDFAYRWALVVLFSSVAIASELVNAIRERHTAHSPSRHYEIIQQRLLRLVSDLAEIAGGNLHIWKVDVYLRRRSMTFSFRTPYVIAFIREHTLTLTETSGLPAEVKEDNVLFGRCFSEATPHAWWNEELTQPVTGENLWSTLSVRENEEFKKNCGVISISPIVDHLGRECNGLLVIHVNPDPEVATTALGALAQPAGKRRLAQACHDIHREMGSNKSSN